MQDRDYLYTSRPSFASADSGSSTSSSTTVTRASSNDHTSPALATPPELILAASASGSFPSTKPGTPTELSSAPRVFTSGPSSSAAGSAPSNAPQKRKIVRRVPRPSTAPSAESHSKTPLLPIVRPTSARSDTGGLPSQPATRGRSPAPSIASTEGSTWLSNGTQSEASRTGDSNAFSRELDDVVLDGVPIDPGPSLSSAALSLSPSISTSSRFLLQSGMSQGPSPHPDSSQSKDWATFLHDYSRGWWDPFQTPLPPRGSPQKSSPSEDGTSRPVTASSTSSSALRRAATTPPIFTPPLAESAIGGVEASTHVEWTSMTNKIPVDSIPPSSKILPQGTVDPLAARHRTRSPSTPPTPSIARRRGAASPNFRLVVPTPTQVSPSPASAGAIPIRPPPRSAGSDPLMQKPDPWDDKSAQSAPTPEQVSAAAAVRLAGVGIDVAPLALPSPELELTDPMRRLKLDSLRDKQREREQEKARSAGRKTSMQHLRGMSSRPSTPLEVIAGSPAGSPNERPSSPGATRLKSGRTSGDYFTLHPSPFASPSVHFQTAPTSLNSGVTYHTSRSDYFGNVPPGSTSLAGLSSQATSPGSSSDVGSRSLLIEGRRRLLPAATPGGDTTGLMPFIAPTTLTPGICGDPNSAIVGASPWGPPVVPSALPAPPYSAASTQSLMSDNGRPRVSSWDPEAWFARYGYLIPPIPHNEDKRRQALYRFNVLYSANDINFDRIAHLAKLVFHTKMVVITLVDGDKQWHKAESGTGFQAGLGAAEADRTVSFCAHTILQNSDEPHIVLDAAKDWRFARNPLVLGPPHIRFYAGAPLRTSDGWNIGTLCIVDDEPRREFSPRSRHTLKEFAAIVMRELELWRDKIQLRIRDRIQTSMEKFTRDSLEIGPDVQTPPTKENEAPNANRMLKIYQEAASLVRRTLEVDGALVLDVSHFEAVETYGTDGKRTVLYHGAPFEGSPDSSIGERSLTFKPIPALPILGQDEAMERVDAMEDYTADEHQRLSTFLSTCKDGKIYERVPSCFRSIIPSGSRYAMIVPVFNVDKRPFLLLCAYNTSRSAHILEGYELQFLRAVGVIILSAILKQRMILADTAKSLFISNISHELRTPLHGILASAELMNDTNLTGTQGDYLKTVTTCAESLVETVNHVLDFTKLSGNVRGSGRVQPVKLKAVDLKHLVEEAVEGSWLGNKAKAMISSTDGIGSVYSPPDREGDESQPKGNSIAQMAFVETIPFVDFRSEGWMVNTDRGGIRRILMNVLGNSMKFTKDGFIRVKLRVVGPAEDHSGRTTFEIAVLDTGKGISREFIKNRLWRPFSQEDPLNTGTGLGLAIVRQIIDSIGGDVDVKSEEGSGTEVRILFHANCIPAPKPQVVLPPSQRVTVGLYGFDDNHSGVQQLRQTIAYYITDWFKLTVLDDLAEPDLVGDINIINDSVEVIEDFIAAGEVTKPLIYLSTSRSKADYARAVDAFERHGGHCAVVFKPCGPAKLEEHIRAALVRIQGLREHPPSSSSVESLYTTAPESPTKEAGEEADQLSLPSSPGVRTPRRLGATPLSFLTRRRSEENHIRTRRPPLGTRSSTYAGNTPPTLPGHAHSFSVGPPPSTPHGAGTDSTASTASSTTVAITDDGSVVLKSALGPSDSTRKPVVLLVDDNKVNRTVLSQWLNKKGYEWKEAVDGQHAVDVFSDHPAGYFDVLLLDLSMPKKNGFEAAREIRSIEQERINSLANFTSGALSPSAASVPRRSKIFALTGLASMEDKRKAFDVGVDGYLIKPVSFKNLEPILRRVAIA